MTANVQKPTRKCRSSRKVARAGGVSMLMFNRAIVKWPGPPRPIRTAGDVTPPSTGHQPPSLGNGEGSAASTTRCRHRAFQQRWPEENRVLKVYSVQRQSWQGPATHSQLWCQGAAAGKQGTSGFLRGELILGTGRQRRGETNARRGVPLWPPSQPCPCIEGCSSSLGKPRPGVLLGAWSIWVSGEIPESSVLFTRP